MKICITRGIYGFRQNGSLVEKTSSSAPFEVDDEEGKRLIAFNVARRVSDEIVKAEISKAEHDTADGLHEKEGRFSVEDLDNMGKEELCRLAEALGLKKTGSKAELIERLKQCPVWVEDTEELDEDEMPELNAEYPE